MPLPGMNTELLVDKSKTKLRGLNEERREGKLKEYEGQLTRKAIWKQYGNYYCKSFLKYRHMWKELKWNHQVIGKTVPQLASYSTK